jgi:peptidoglycan/LPS O-acetylase OafA/YrhL
MSVDYALKPKPLHCTSIQPFVYRPEIDGLRAIAILGVFLFHLSRQWLPGGFVGVDVFFVISGYLITSILCQDCEAERFSLAKFYQRRIARLFPAFFTVALVTLAAAYLVFTPQDFASAGANLVAASLSLANIKYMFQGNYFALSPDAQPFLHYWSLSVEEQFYLFFPITLFLIFQYARRHVFTILAILGAGSFAASALLTPVNPVWAFYLLPTRAWQLTAGCLIAVLPYVTGKERIETPRWLSAVGLCLIGASFALIHEGPHFPGLIAALPVVGAVAIILPGGNAWARRRLSSSIMVGIGKVSYSLYLWHWPVFSLVDYEFYLLSESARIAMKAGICIALTLASYHLIEKPARIFLNRPQTQRIAYAALAATLGLCVPLGLAVRNNNYVNAELADVRNGGLVFQSNSGAHSVVLMGDSNGSMYGKVMKEIAKKMGYNLTVISVAAGDPLPRTTLWYDSSSAIAKIRPDYLVIAIEWRGKLHSDPERLSSALNELKPHVGRIVLLNQPPMLPDEASRLSMRNGSRPPFQEDAIIRADRLRTNKFLLGFQSANVLVLDISQHFETEKNEIISVDEQGKLLYQDSGHLSGYGAARVRNAILQALQQPAGE